MKLCSISLDITEKPAKIYFIGDVHVGNINFARENFNFVVNKIRNEANSFVIGMGDYIDAINTKDKRFNPEEIDPQYKLKDLHNIAYVQCNDFIDIMQPIKNKILAMLSGNHESKLKSIYEFDAYNYICDKLNVSNRLGYIGIVSLRIQISKMVYRTHKILLNHGIGGNGKREGYPLNTLHDVFRWSNCDINVMGHIHQLATDKKIFISTKKWGKNEIEKIPRYYFISGCYLKTYNSDTSNYFEHKGRFDSTIGSPYVMFEKSFQKDNAEVTITYGTVEF